MPLKHLIAAAAAALLPGLLGAAELSLPDSAARVSKRVTALGVYQLPIGSEDADKVPSERFEGQITRRTWRVEGRDTVLQILAPLRDQLKQQGYEVRLDCAARDCGGFGFRFGIEVVPAPDMMVDVSRYHFLSAARGAEAVSVLVSRAGGAAFVQVINVHPAATAPSAGKPAGQAQKDPGQAQTGQAQTGQAQTGPVRPVELAKVLQVRGHAVLTDLVFESGSTRLRDGQYDSLKELAVFLTDHPQYRLLLVGHTDTVGSQAQNVGISKRRAQSVKDRLTKAYEADTARIDVAGAGFLAPIASNLIPEGREANRRVEAVLLTD